ncbi:MAG: NUDIX domain-containing protein [Gemmatimonadota bacterium]
MSEERAGAITVRRYRGRTLLLLVRAKGTTRRVFPKGHLERGESADQAALRELEEEAGFSGRILAPAGEAGFKMESATVPVEYFLVLATKRISDGEPGRDPIWVDPRVGLNLLAYEDVRSLLEKLLPTIDRLKPAGTRSAKDFDDLVLMDFQHPGLTSSPRTIRWPLLNWFGRLLHRRQWEREALRS